MVKEKYLPYVEPDQPPEPPKSPKEIKKEKRENFWFYNKTKIIVALCVVAAILITWQPWKTTIDPDYTVGLMSQYYWSDSQLEAVSYTHLSIASKLVLYIRAVSLAITPSRYSRNRSLSIEIIPSAPPEKITLSS